MKLLSSILSTIILTPIAGSLPGDAFPQQPLEQPVVLTNTVPSQRDLERVIDASPLLSFHRDIVQIESISGNEAAVGDYIVQFLQERRFAVTKQFLPSEADKGNDDAATAKSGPQRFNIFAYPSWISEPKILLTSHIDTVPPYLPYSLSLPDDAISNSSSTTWRERIRIAGRGTVDAKASVAAQVFAVLQHLEVDPTAPLGLLFVVGEEVSGDGMRWFAESDLNPTPPRLHTVIFGEPTEHALVAGHKGSLSLTVRARGKAAHSGYPWLGKSAVSAILPALERLDRLGDIPVKEGGLPGSKKLGKSTVNIGRMEGGVAGNVVPVSASASLIVRLAHPDVESARQRIEDAVYDATGGDPDVEVQWNFYGNAPIDFDADVPGFNVTTVNYATDAFYLRFPTGNVKRYLYGPGSIFVAHGADEAITVGDLERAVEGYRRLIEAADRRV
ncbi:hypothetical protein VTN49DRAFT_3833 [Thermomyces lanuginosus]|uniref:uncharacterized protein n=1 Tax=Thermomyces lanuginosus TaxID=5541 RepID=UPI003743C957